MNRLAIILAAIVVGSVQPVCSVYSQRKTTADVLEKHMAGGNLQEETVEGAFISCLGRARLPGGIVRVLGCEDRLTPGKVALPEGTVRDGLEAIVHISPSYRWQAGDGVVNLLPTREQPALLDVRIALLRVDKAPSVRSAVATLVALPEVRSALVRLELVEGVRILHGPISLEPEPPFSVDCRNVTVRGALNEIVRREGRAVWEYKEAHCDGKNEFWISVVAE